MTENGRGAWNSKGVGGTLKLSKGKIVPGPYYMYSQNDWTQVGIKTYLFNLVGQPSELSDLAVYHGVVAIQVLLNHADIQTPINGVFTKDTDTAVKAFQGSQGTVRDGVVGKKTMEKLLLPVIKANATRVGVDWRPIYGILQGEGNFDPGAVGYLDTADLGLAQINTHSHPDVTISEAFCPSFAVSFVADLFDYRLFLFKELDLAVASYNLGVGGTREWIQKGRPDVWTPSWATAPRNTRKYIDNILKASEGLQ